jgi:hypothetical protein
MWIEKVSGAGDGNRLIPGNQIGTLFTVRGDPTKDAGPGSQIQGAFAKIQYLTYDPM